MSTNSFTPINDFPLNTLPSNGRSTQVLDENTRLVDESSRAIAELQTNLRSIMSPNSTLAPIVVNGVFGPETTAAVKSFQRQFGRLFGLTPTGTVDKATWEAIRTVSNDVKNYYASPISISPFPAPTWEISNPFNVHMNDESPLVSIIQSLFNLLARKYSNYLLTSSLGRFDNITMENVLSLQKSSALPQTGAVDKRTWDALAHLFNSLENEMKM